MNSASELFGLDAGPARHVVTTNPEPARAAARRSAGAALLAALALSLLAACGDDADGASGATDELEITMHDFHYGDALPASVPAGTKIVASNDSATELHEFVAVRLADDDERPIGEIVQGDLGAVFATPPSAVILVPPGGDAEAIVAVGDGTLQEPGRYLVICAIPTGADPAEYLAAAATSEGPPQVDGGPPHFTEGMFAELTVVP